MRRSLPNPGLLAWWSTTSEQSAVSSSAARAPSRPGDAASRLTKKATSVGSDEGGTRSSAPGNQPSDAGRLKGSGKVASTRAPRRRSPSASARVLPSASASGWTWPEITTVDPAAAAAASTSTAAAVCGATVAVIGSPGGRGVIRLGLHPATADRVGGAVVGLVGGDAVGGADVPALAPGSGVTRGRLVPSAEPGRGLLVRRVGGVRIDGPRHDAFR